MTDSQLNVVSEFTMVRTGLSLGLRGIFALFDKHSWTFREALVAVVRERRNVEAELAVFFKHEREAHRSGNFNLSHDTHTHLLEALLSGNHFGTKHAQWLIQESVAKTMNRLYLVPTQPILNDFEAELGGSIFIDQFLSLVEDTYPTKTLPFGNNCLQEVIAARNVIDKSFKEATKQLLEVVKILRRGRRFEGECEFGHLIAKAIAGQLRIPHHYAEAIASQAIRHTHEHATAMCCFKSSNDQALTNDFVVLCSWYVFRHQMLVGFERVIVPRASELAA